jgi:hypothetical protein
MDSARIVVGNNRLTVGSDSVNTHPTVPGESGYLFSAP